MWLTWRGVHSLHVQHVWMYMYTLYMYSVHVFVYAHLMLRISGPCMLYANAKLITCGVGHPLVQWRHARFRWTPLCCVIAVPYMYMYDVSILHRSVQHLHMLRYCILPLSVCLVCSLYEHDYELWVMSAPPLHRSTALGHVFCGVITASARDEVRHGFAYWCCETLREHM